MVLNQIFKDEVIRSIFPNCFRSWTPSGLPVLFPFKPLRKGSQPHPSLSPVPFTWGKISPDWEWKQHFLSSLTCQPHSYSELVTLYPGDAWQRFCEPMKVVKLWLFRSKTALTSPQQLWIDSFCLEGFPQISQLYLLLSKRKKGQILGNHGRKQSTGITGYIRT